MSILRDQRLRVFHAVAVRRSFTGAGNDLRLTQQAVSFQVRSLEKELDLSLFIRSHHSVELTPAGAILFAHADKILSVYEEATRSLAEYKQENARHLRIAATNTISKYAMPKAIQAFKRHYPNIQIILEIGNSAKVMDYLSRGAVDIAVTSDGSPLLSNYRVTPLFRDEIAFVVCKEHPWALKEELSLNDLLATPLIMREEGSGTRALLERHLSSRGLSLNILKVALVVGSPEAVKEAALAGVGVGVLSGLRVRRESLTHGLILKGIADFQIMRDFYLVRPLNGSATSILTKFMSILRESIAA
ncbi:LysR substrate-binding domain-containing protein [Ensifer aridi]|uniref:LysR substrate-binding domain-containing protein n=1 Tax=Ensifer aridi TaxID=1708715 RepID=UPI0015E44967|nr:LysR substrate-binding domain-containing protein [Ensifer aridi]